MMLMIPDENLTSKSECKSVSATRPQQIFRKKTSARFDETRLNCLRHRWATSHGKRKKKQTSKKIMVKRNSTKSNRLFLSIHTSRTSSGCVIFGLPLMLDHVWNRNNYKTCTDSELTSKKYLKTDENQKTKNQNHCCK
jgi:hypothetical protein